MADISVKDFIARYNGAISPATLLRAQLDGFNTVEGTDFDIIRKAYTTPRGQIPKGKKEVKAQDLNFRPIVPPKFNSPSRTVMDEYFGRTAAAPPTPMYKGDFTPSPAAQAAGALTSDQVREAQMQDRLLANPAPPVSNLAARDLDFYAYNYPTSDMEPDFAHPAATPPVAPSRGMARGVPPEQGARSSDSAYTIRDRANPGRVADFGYRAPAAPQSLWGRFASAMQRYDSRQRGFKSPDYITER